jgi:hypothetical protein
LPGVIGDQENSPTPDVRLISIPSSNITTSADKSPPTQAESYEIVTVFNELVVSNRNGAESPAHPAITINITISETRFFTIFSLQQELKN